MVEQLDILTEADRSLFPGSFTIRALRDSRYHNSAYAIAELIDNAIEANAPLIELLCMEEPQMVRERTRRLVSEIAVLDNGTGMDVMTLLEALKFGGGTRHNSNRGIGKYGMGLPTSSMSQCKRVDVWTWQDGLNSVWHSSIDADDIESGNHLVPLPDSTTPIPEIWRLAGSDTIYQNRSGTLVVWSKLDKIQWKTSHGLIDNTSREVGRIHRHYINAGIHTIRAASFIKNQPRQRQQEMTFVANDPLYLMSPTSVTESPWDNEPMFSQWGPTKYYTPTVDGREVTIEVKYSIVKPEALRTETVSQNPGNTERGRHARHNIGVSVVREDREIVLEDAFLREGGSADNPQNRWWGCEIHFRRSCDELFGVDHNKQMAANFTQAAKTLARDDRPNQVVLDELGIEDELIYQIVSDIRDQTRSMMRQIGQMFAQKRSQNGNGSHDGQRNPERKAAKTATEADREAVAAGEEQPTETDIDRERIPPEEREEGLTEQFVQLGQAREDAQQLARRLIEEDLSYQFNSAQLDGSLMFNVRSNQAVLHINLNTDHPIYDLLKHIEGDLADNVDESDPAFQASVAIRLLLSSWARMEDQTESREERMRIQNIAINWGRQVEKVINYLRERSE